MKTKSLKFDKKTGRPESLVVKMTLPEAILIAKYCGGLSPATSPNHEASGEIYDCLVGELFNRFWDAGLEGAVRGDDE